MSFCCFRPTLHVPLGGRVDVSSCRGGELCTIVPEPEAARPTLVDRRPQILVVGPSGQNGVGFCCSAGSTSASAASSSMAAPARALGQEGSDKLCVHSYELCREPLDRGRDLGDGGAIACRGYCQVRDSVNRLLFKVPVVRVCGGAMCGRT